MKILVFEGIASSGKTSIERRLLDRLAKSQIIKETKTLMPIIDNEDLEVAKGHLEQLLDQFKDGDSDVLILDRFHITHAFRTQSDIADFSAIEDMLVSLGEVQIVLLTIKEDAIRGRIKETIEYRKDGWSKGGRGTKTINEKVIYYAQQQQELRKIVSESSLSSIELDTTKKNWNECVEKLLELL